MSESVECVRCLYTSDHPFGLTFNEKGECSGCQVHREKQQLNWDERENRLGDLLDARPKDRDYDCVVPLRGTPEYFDVLNILVNRWGLRVLATTYNHQFNSSVGIRNLALMRQHFDVDFVSYTSNPNDYKKYVRESIVRMGSVQWPAICGATAFPVSEAFYRNIPLVIWPYHQATEQVGAHSYTEEVEMSRMSRHSFDLMSLEPEQLSRSRRLENHDFMSDLFYPSDVALMTRNIRGLYLANYYPWDSRASAERGIEQWGAEPARNSRTYDTYDRVDDLTYMGLHDHLKYARLGYSRVTDSLVQEIRFGRVSKIIAREIQDFYRNEGSQSLVELLARWLGVQPVSLAWLVQFHQSELEFVVNPSSLASLEDFFHSTPGESLSSEAHDFVRGFAQGTVDLRDEQNFLLFHKGLSLDDIG